MAGLGIFVILIMILVIIGIFVIPFVFYLIELQNTLKEVKEENRFMRPGQVWLLFIPLFSVYWYFEVVSRIANSLRAEFDDRNIEVEEERPGYAAGLVICIAGAASLLVNFITRIYTAASYTRYSSYSSYNSYSRYGMYRPENSIYTLLGSSVLSIVIGIVSLIFFIIYWVKINGYRHKIIEAKRAGL